MLAALLNLFKFLYSTRYLHYGLIGALGNGINLSTTFVLTEWARIYYMISYIVATLGTWIIMFFLHSRITFSGHNRQSQFQRFLKFITVYGTGFLLNSTLVFLLTEYIHLYYMLSILSVTVVLSTGTFLVNKKRVFKK